MSTEQQQGSWQEPGQRMVLTWPGQVPTPLGALLQEAGVATDPQQDQLAALQEQIDTLRADMQRQIDQLREGTSAGEELEVEHDDDYDEWTVNELKAELENRDLSISGAKVELIDRLREDDAA